MSMSYKRALHWGAVALLTGALALTAALERGIPVSQEYASDEFTYSYLGGSWNVYN